VLSQSVKDSYLDNVRQSVTMNGQLIGSTQSGGESWRRSGRPWI
jgi:hypothetical protein